MAVIRKRLGGHAVVIGASLSGLLTARVLADHFDRVTLIERDSLPSDPVFRKGVPQARQPHNLLIGGRRILEELYPGFSSELIANGAMDVEWTADLLGYSEFGWGKREKTGLMALSCSRFLIDWVTSRRTLGIPGVRIRERHDVVDLTSDGARVTGVVIRPRDNPTTSDLERVPADLVVDASGRSSPAPKWLTKLDLPAPEEEVIDAKVGYATRIYRRGPTPDWTAMLILTSPNSPLGGNLVPIEGDRWMAAVIGVGDAQPPTDEAGWLEFARNLPVPILYDAVKDAEPLSPVFSYRNTENMLRRYDRCDRYLEGFLVTGDAACAFNPVYAQGMTIAAMSAKTLGWCLRAASPAPGFPGLARKFQRAQHRGTKVAWQMATGSDLGYPHVKGPKPGLLGRIVGNYLNQVGAAAADGGVVGRTFLEVLHLISPPSVLFRPGIVRAVRRHGKAARAARR